MTKELLSESVIKIDRDILALLLKRMFLMQVDFNITCKEDCCVRQWLSEALDGQLQEILEKYVSN